MTESPASLELSAARERLARAKEESSLVAIVTLVVWLGCAAVGAAGLIVPYARAQWRDKKPEPTPVIAQVLTVELAPEPLLPAVNPSAPPTLSDPPPTAPPLVARPIPSMLAVAEPTPGIAFAVPMEAPARVVEASEASFRTPEVAPKEIPAPSASAAEPLTFGQGAGRQPAPEYPRQALREGQEGTVVVRFTVGENGRVFAAEAVMPSPWPLLNDAAKRAVRDRWRFPAGSMRIYEVPIHFQIKR